LRDNTFRLTKLCDLATAADDPGPVEADRLDLAVIDHLAPPLPSTPALNSI
jgi:hypothetical protein